MKKTVYILIMLLVMSTFATPVLKVGFVGHDHQSALYVAAQEAEKTKKDCGVYLKEVTAKKHYEMMKDGKKIADVELYKAGGGSKMPTMMSQGTFEVGFGGVAAIAFFNDKGSPMKIVSPLQTKGDMLVLPPDTKVQGWKGFVEYVKATKEPVKIGYKKPVAVAKLIFERALKEEGLSFTGDASKKDAEVLMVNMKGAKNLNPSLKNGVIDGYVANNPGCAIAQDKGIGKIVADLNTLPPGIYKDHPCCAIGATDKAVKEKGPIVKEFLKLMILATNYMNEDPKGTAAKVAKWIGTPLHVEEESMASSGYTTVPNDYYMKTLNVWVDDMNHMGKLKGGLKGKTGADAAAVLTDFSLLEEAAKELKAAGVEKRF